MRPLAPRRARVRPPGRSRGPPGGAGAGGLRVQSWGIGGRSQDRRAHRARPGGARRPRRIGGGPSPPDRAPTTWRCSSPSTSRRAPSCSRGRRPGTSASPPGPERAVAASCGRTSGWSRCSGARGRPGGGGRQSRRGGASRALVAPTSPTRSASAAGWSQAPHPTTGELHGLTRRYAWTGPPTPGGAGGGPAHPTGCAPRTPVPPTPTPSQSARLAEERRGLRHADRAVLPRGGGRAGRGLAGATTYLRARELDLEERELALRERELVLRERGAGREPPIPR